jgi:hypothetical protein
MRARIAVACVFAFGLAFLVLAAGRETGGKKGDEGHMGCFQGVSNSNAIRDLMVERLRQYRDSGLGEAAHANPVEDRALDAARSVLAETRSLRKHLVPSASD